MRFATMAISLGLALVLGLMSCGDIGRGSLEFVFSETRAGQEEGVDVAGGGVYGAVTVVLWGSAAGLVLRIPEAAMWVFAVAGVVCVVGASAGLSEFVAWAVASFVFAAMSWRAIREQALEDAAERTADEDRHAWLARVEAKAKARPPE